MGGQIEPFAARIGADTARAVVVKSPFDFQRNMRVYVASDVPLPSPQEAKLALDVLADYVGFCTQAVRGGTLVLRTADVPVVRFDPEALETIVENLIDNRCVPHPN